MKTLLEHLQDYEKELLSKLEAVRKHIGIASETAKNDPATTQDTTGGGGGDQPPTGPGIP